MRLGKIWDEADSTFKEEVSRADFIKGTWGEPMNPTFFIQEFFKNLKEDRVQAELCGEVAL